ncbi:ty3-gypsy retrotransposon protein [Gossypium australe]|uniref:Ty3-gypsy retrotransposon protein n=1 Tax=Gossypium australe TaxID=47621 RepID=A0A5B6UZS7_9ROSI|nr:ty3-gypsy retrotransposon protein [Gossypium australe]
MRQHRWIELLKDYDFIIEYHIGKANIEVNASSQKLMPVLTDQIKEMQSTNAKLAEKRKLAQQGDNENFSIDKNNCLQFHN